MNNVIVLLFIDGVFLENIDKEYGNTKIEMEKQG